MILSDRDIKKAIEEKRIIIDPLPNLKQALGTCSLDLRLGRVFRVFDHSKYPYIDPAKKNFSSEITKKVIVADGEGFIMQPGEFALAVTLERVRIPNNLMGRLEGRSSLGRLGIVVHSTASIFDAGWDGKCVLELGNLGRMAVKLTPGMRICAMSFEELTSEADIPYTNRPSSKYVGQKEPEESRLSEEK